MISRMLKKIIIFFRNYNIEIVLVGLFCILFGGIFCIFLYLNQLSLKNLYNNSPYHVQSIAFVIRNDDENAIDLSELSDENALNECVIYKYDYDQPEYYEIVFWGNKGIRLQQSIGVDHQSKERYVFAGEHTGYGIKDIVLKNGKEYVVTGIIEKSASDVVNYSLFYVEGKLEEVECGKSYILSGKNKKIINEAYTTICEQVEKKGGQVRKIDLRNVQFQDFVAYKNNMIMVLVICLVLCILFVLFLYKVWKNNKEPEMLVLTILGDTGIRMRNRAKFLMIWLISWGLCAVCVRLLGI